MTNQTNQTNQAGQTKPNPPPILVTGTHRSGTTWVGETVALSPTVHYVHEPFAPMYERSWLRTPPRQRYYHEPAAAAGAFATDLDRITALRPPWLAIARRAGGVRNAVRLAQEAASTAQARRAGARALIKDPFALLSAEWIANRTGADVVVLVRHPAAFVSSVKRLNWRLDVGWLLDQPALVNGDLAPFVDELERDRADNTDLIAHAALVWRVLNTVTARYSRDHPDWNVLRYEDLAADPVPGFHALYNQLGVAWSERISASIQRMNAPDNTAKVRDGDKGSTRRDSRQAMRTWQHRLTPDEIDRVRALTGELAEQWYPASSWSASPV